ncbi:MAG TPA: hypothetical protein VM434_06105 [Beijerinckiaceae bacterium]|nr:hypothetical protein [Beijerinckiaceae bacterium]
MFAPDLKKTALLGAAAAVAFGIGSFAAPAPAEAQWGPGWRHAGYARPYYGPPRVHRRVAYGYPVYRHRRPNPGPAIAAGVIGGLALGAIASQAYAQPYYAPVYGGYYSPVVVQRRCWTEQQITFDPWGRQYVQHVRVCG